LTNLEVGEIPMPEGSVLMVALTLVRIFPHIYHIESVDGNWGKVADAIRLSGRIVGYPCKDLPLSTPRSSFSDPPFPGATLEDGA
jgi:hypothetical protein